MGGEFVFFKSVPLHIVQASRIFASLDILETYFSTKQHIPYCFNQLSSAFKFCQNIVIMSLSYTAMISASNNPYTPVVLYQRIASIFCYFNLFRFSLCKYSFNN